jgi:hypothetical protein
MSKPIQNMWIKALKAGVQLTWHIRSNDFRAQKLNFISLRSANIISHTFNSNISQLHRQLVLAMQQRSHGSYNGTLFLGTESFVGSTGSWQWCMTLRFTGVLDFVHCPGLKTQHFRNWICFSPQMKGRRCLLCWIPLNELSSITSKRLNRAGIFSLHMRMDTGPVSEMSWPSFLILDDEQSPEPQ